MEREYILRTANTAKLQLIASTSKNTIFSWGISKFFAVNFNGMAALGITLDGRLHKGNVIVALDEGRDLYCIYLLGEDGAKCVCEGAFADQLGDLIDIAVERGRDEKEYRAFVEEGKRRIFRGEI